MCICTRLKWFSIIQQRWHSFAFKCLCFSATHSCETFRFFLFFCTCTVKYSVRITLLFITYLCKEMKSRTEKMTPSPPPPPSFSVPNSLKASQCFFNIYIYILHRICDKIWIQVLRNLSKCWFSQKTFEGPGLNRALILCLWKKKEHSLASCQASLPCETTRLDEITVNNWKVVAGAEMMECSVWGCSYTNTIRSVFSWFKSSVDWQLDTARGAPGSICGAFVCKCVLTNRFQHGLSVAMYHNSDKSTGDESLSCLLF